MVTIRSVVLCLVVLAFGASNAVVASTCDAINSDDVVKAEDARYAAQMANDFPAMEKLIADDLVYIHSSSVVERVCTVVPSSTAAGGTDSKLLR